ncbi:MAG TPA: LacI family DNA-binding transcriptional regulator [Bacteroidales bacterium]|nr:LacI family DNA-binding transcriptional regulator [Bacteroidales bacterium]HRR94415.1 LacI family DNA-binding transcriptional regulator [Bacteroidales bacterium]HRT90451.1 LacI family DNA-binding transcriptional regulator [Bacteroidales bacterium]
MKEEKDVTIYDIAEKLGISPSTVSRALSNHKGISERTRLRIQDTARKMNYRPNRFASSLRLKKTLTLGVLVPKLNSYFMASVIAGIESVASRYGYNLIIANSQESGKKEAEGLYTLYNSRVDGMIVSLAYDTSSMKHFSMVLKKGIPVVFFDRVSECNGCARVYIDNVKAGYEVTSHLVQQGCRRIMHVGGNMLRNVYRDRYIGYKKALEESGLEYRESLVVVNDLTERAGAEVAGKILKMKDLPDAVFTSNDTTAVSIILNLKKEGVSVPGDIAIAGFNNEPVSRVIEPNLTTVNYPAREVGETAAMTLVNNLTSELNNTGSDIVLRHELIVRESSMKKAV